jgi:pimeloyl-ACP methyl ester carboxylesterase
MRQHRIHRATTEDGVEIAGRVHGEGPPLVFVHGALGDGDTAWESLLPFMKDQYTCYVMSLRGRGLSGIRRGNDLSREHLTADVTAFLDSVGEPVGVVGLSSGALLSLAAAEKTSSVSAVAAYEPPILEVMSEEVAARFKDTVQRMGEVAATGRMAEAARTFLEFVTNEEELTAVSEMKLPDAFAPNVPVQLEEFPRVLEGESSPTHPSALTKIEVPVLLMHGTRSQPHPWFLDGVHHVAAHVPNAQVREIAGAGHLGPILEPGAVADELHRFFSTARRAA